MPRSSVDNEATKATEDQGPRTEDTQTPLRDDRVRPSIDRDAVAKNAPDWDDGFFVVPVVIEGES